MKSLFCSFVEIRRWQFWYYVHKNPHCSFSPFWESVNAAGLSCVQKWSMVVEDTPFVIFILFKVCLTFFYNTFISSALWLCHMCSLFFFNSPDLTDISSVVVCRHFICHLLVFRSTLVRKSGFIFTTFGKACVLFETLIGMCECRSKQPTFTIIIIMFSNQVLICWRKHLPMMWDYGNDFQIEHSIIIVDVGIIKYNTNRAAMFEIKQYWSVCLFVWFLICT